MRVLIVNKFLYPNGGSETYIFEIGKQLLKMGHEVQYFGMEHEDNIVGNSVNSYTSSMDFHTGTWEKLLYPFKIIYSREARKKIRAVLEDFHPDVIHLNNFNFQITPSIIYEIRKWEKKQERKTAMIYTAHDSQWVCPNHLMMIPSNGERCFRCRNGKFINCARNQCIHNSRIKSLLGMIEAMVYHHLKTYRKVDAIICPSRFMAKQLATDTLLDDKLKTIYNFIDNNALPEVEKKNYVLYFGRYSEEKGVRTLLKACSALPEIPFVFAGDGPLKEELSNHNNIHNVGFLKGDELQKTIGEARFAVFPSECFENCPFTVMEALSYGTPMIASDIGGVPELMQDGVTGELFEAGNAEELIRKIKKLWEDTLLCEKYTDNCRNVSFDSVEEYCEKLLEIYSIFDG